MGLYFCGPRGWPLKNTSNPLRRVLVELGLTVPRGASRVVRALNEGGFRFNRSVYWRSGDDCRKDGKPISVAEYEADLERSRPSKAGGGGAPVRLISIEATPPVFFGKERRKRKEAERASEELDKKATEIFDSGRDLFMECVGVSSRCC